MFKKTIKRELIDNIEAKKFYIAPSLSDGDDLGIISPGDIIFCLEICGIIYKFIIDNIEERFYIYSEIIELFEDISDLFSKKEKKTIIKYILNSYIINSPNVQLTNTLFYDNIKKMY